MVLDLLFGWVLALDLWLGIFALAFIITLLMTLVYKWATDQQEMKRLKKQLKDLQAKMRKQRDNPKKAMQLQKKLMSLNGTYMKKSLKPALYTFIPIIIVFGWMATNLAFAPVMVGDSVVVSVELEQPAYVSIEASGVSVDGALEQETLERQVSWQLVAEEEGVHTLVFSTREGASASRDLVVGSLPDASIVSLDAPFKEAEVDYPKATPFGDFSIFGYEPGWLATYIFFSILLSVLLRKLLGVA